MIDPDERAVAPRDTAETGGLPEVTAIGRDAMAAKLETIAAAHSVPVKGDADRLAALDKLDMGNAMPTVAFAAASEILTQLYRANAALVASGGSS